jgi:hypothetical protein
MLKRREFEKKYPEHGKKVVVIPEAVSPARFPSQTKEVSRRYRNSLPSIAS